MKRTRQNKPMRSYFAYSPRGTRRILLFCFLLLAVSACRKTKTTQPAKGDTFFKIYNNQMKKLDTGQSPGASISYLVADAAGSLYLNYSFNGYGYTMKTDKFGNLLWNKNGFGVSATDGKYIYSSFATYSATSWTDTFQRYDTSGRLLSQFALPSFVNGEITYAPYSGDIVSVNVIYTVSGINYQYPLVTLINPLTGIVWTNNDFADSLSLIANNKSWFFNTAGVVQTADKGFTTSWILSKTPRTNYIDSVFLVLYHFDYQGNVKWQKQISTGYYWNGPAIVGGADSQYSTSIIYANTIISDNAGNCVIAGVREYAARFSPPVANSIELWKIDPEGNLIDSAEIRIGYSPYLFGNASFMRKKDGNYFLIVTSQAGAGLSLNNAYSMIDINPDLSIRSITPFAPEANGSTISSAIATGDGHIAVSGTINTSAKTPDIYILKMNEDEKY